ncbi:hypothetical protein Vadar_009344 [Vaccinium darrowii]|uniref:Uncharacterized protein n=1 Tax=Vaccinium darrowii TaxID=229202 RepID=A0ACB7Y6C0_9ERIC|nr:hypothetical protein Vadar_009344 [Vaccinium darrowii]
MWKDNGSGQFFSTAENLGVLGKKGIRKDRSPTFLDTAQDPYRLECRCCFDQDGMPGAAALRDCKILESVVNKQAADGRFYAAVCAPPAVTLGSWGLLKGKKATCYPSFMEQLSSSTITVESRVQQDVSGKKATAFPPMCNKLSDQGEIENRVVVDSNLITSRGPGTSMEFALAIVEKFFGHEKALELAKTMLVVNA